MKTAKWIKNLDNFKAYASLYELSEPVQYQVEDKEYTFEKTNHVVVWADTFLGQHETLTFGASEDGEILSYLEIPAGSFRGECNHVQAIIDLGYTETQS